MAFVWTGEIFTQPEEVLVDYSDHLALSFLLGTSSVPVKGRGLWRLSSVSLESESVWHSSEALLQCELTKIVFFEFNVAVCKDKVHLELTPLTSSRFDLYMRCPLAKIILRRVSLALCAPFFSALNYAELAYGVLVRDHNYQIRELYFIRQLERSKSSSNMALRRDFIF
ncbi:hypothetical protein XELAEV_18046752mg [Xenopus laevis]|uniref:Uncharacterized protein n=1 Tax=Xenopus laevis TaxID=8355 RepID=A0A974BTY9_XENLA|nr:hypothetical protein XELAEV_18046752mg [Xenopus laevis]